MLAPIDRQPQAILLRHQALQLFFELSNAPPVQLWTGGVLLLGQFALQPFALPANLVFSGNQCVTIQTVPIPGTPAE